jgi:hypothetical protein
MLVGSALDDWYLEVMAARICDFVYVSDVLADYRVHGLNLHARTTLARSDEPFVEWFLNKVFDEKEHRPQLETQKQTARKDIYAGQYLTLARKYFGLGMLADARRCYLRAIRSRPPLLFQADVVRQLTGTFLGARRYERLKRLLRAKQRFPRSFDSD